MLDFFEGPFGVMDQNKDGDSDSRGSYGLKVAKHDMQCSLLDLLLAFSEQTGLWSHFYSENVALVGVFFLFFIMLWVYKR